MVLELADESACDFYTAGRAYNGSARNSTVLFAARRAPIGDVTAPSNQLSMAGKVLHSGIVPLLL